MTATVRLAGTKHRDDKMSDKSYSEYEDIIFLPHHQSKVRRHMSMHDRAAQFGAFAALTGYDAAIEETARLTDERIEPDESVKADINGKLVYIMEHDFPSDPITVTHYVPDPYKDGGAYKTNVGSVLKIDSVMKIVYMENDVKIFVDDIISLEGDSFKE